MTAQGMFDAKALSTCISCGFCLPACPTYAFTGDEAASPRGRIALMRAIDVGEVDVFDTAAREQGSFCLGCRACEPACPAGVPYGRLIEQLRDAQWTGRRRPWRIVPLLVFAAHRRLIRAAGLLRRHARHTPAAEFGGSGAAVQSGGSGAAVQPGEPGDMLLLGCFERVLFPAVSRAAADTIPGLRVPREQGCCGALHAHNGQSGRGEELARQLAEQGGRIVSTAGGCAAHLASVIGRDRVADYSEALLERGIPVGAVGAIGANGRRARIGLQDSCHLRNGMGTTKAPRDVIGALGDYVEVPGAGDCCGAAGTYSILRRADSRRILADKISELARLDLDFLVVVNPGCQRQMAGALRRARMRTRVVHLAELVAMAQAEAEAVGP